MEAFGSILTHQLAYGSDFVTHDDSGLQILESIARFREARRPHGSVGYLFPADFAATFRL